MLPELLGAFYATVNNRMRQDAIHFGYYNWLDSPNNKFRTTPSFIMNQVSGILNSHFVGVNSQVMKDELINSASAYTNDKAKEIMDQKIKIMYPGSTAKDFSNGDYDSNLIAFNHRLNRFTNLPGLIDNIEYAFPGDKPFKVWATDRSNKSSRVEKPWLKWENLPSFDAYMEKLKTINFGISTHIIYCMWSMSVIDMLSLGKPVLLPYNTSVFKEMVPEDYPFFYKDKKEFALKFKELLNRDFMDERRKIHDFITKTFTWERFARTIIENFEASFSEQRFLDKTNSLTLTNLLDLVNTHKAVSKHELFTKNISALGSRVSFSYPYARRNLLLKGIKDDTERSETVYYVGDRPTSLPTFDKITVRKEDASRFRLVQREVVANKSRGLKSSWS